MDKAILAAAVALAEQREPFALATIVWRRAPSSGHVGAKAIIRADGTMQGWLGGACAQPTVVREAQAAMVDGQPRLLFLGQSDELAAHAREGIVTVPMACESEGALEVYVEPMLPAPHVVVVGQSPAVTALAALAGDIGWDVAVVDDADLSTLGIGSGSAVVVATQGRYDDLALESALQTPAAYIGLVASAKRAAATLELLRDRGVDDDQLHRVVAPAGLDLGPVENAEIAVAVLADLVARRASGHFRATPLSTPRPTATDPICGMTVDVLTARHVVHHDGHDVFFCAAACKAEFVQRCSS